MTLITQYLPGIPVFPAIGNNDCYYHNSAPSAENATQYYSDLWTVFFEQVPANLALLQDPVVYLSVYTSWMQGGYFAVNLTSEIVLISMNGIYPFYSNK